MHQEIKNTLKNWVLCIVIVTIVGLILTMCDGWVSEEWMGSVRTEATL